MLKLTRLLAALLTVAFAYPMEGVGAVQEAKSKRAGLRHESTTH
jgi:hypothetical protein